MKLYSWCKKLVRGRLISLVSIAVFCAACSRLTMDSIGKSENDVARPVPTPTWTPFQPLSSTAIATSPLPTPNDTIPLNQANVEEGWKEKTFWQPEYIPPMIGACLESLPGYQQAESPNSAAVRIRVGDEYPFAEWIYALVAPYPTVRDEFSAQSLREIWLGDSRSSPAGGAILMSDETYEVLRAWWGEAVEGAVRVVPESKLLDLAWAEQPSLAIVPFEGLEPRWKVLEVDGQSPLRHDFNPDQYALTIPFSLDGDIEAVQTLIHELGLTAPESGEALLTNRAANKLATVALTGVTALVRATAFTMRRNGITYPARDIGALLRDADITHISNEIPFTPDCPPPNPTQEDLRFCSDPAYIALLDEVGTDIVELTGDHFGDWGPEAMRFTLELYTLRGWPYYGGGYDREDARQARLLEVKSNRFAFIGCNAKGGGYATAGVGQPGAVACDFEWMEREIKRLTRAGYQVIATFQHFEYYTYAPQPLQVQDFRRLAEAGAVVVSGSQAHQPQAMEFYKGSFIHYGLGNLFFDQYHYCSDYACDDAFIDLHIFYEGRYLGNELITIVFEDYARPRLMSRAEREEFLAKLFSASGW